MELGDVRFRPGTRLTVETQEIDGARLRDVGSYAAVIADESS